MEWLAWRGWLASDARLRFGNKDLLHFEPSGALPAKVVLHGLHALPHLLEIHRAKDGHERDVHLRADAHLQVEVGRVRFGLHRGAATADKLVRFHALGVWGVVVRLLLDAVPARAGNKSNGVARGRCLLGNGRVATTLVAEGRALGGGDQGHRVGGRPPHRGYKWRLAGWVVC